MEHSRKWLTALAGAVGLMLSSYAIGDDGRYIIQFAPGQAGQGVAAVKAMGGEVKVDLTNRSVNAVAATLPDQAIKGLMNNPNIALIEEDTRRYPLAQETPFGIPMVQADQVSDENAGNRMVCIIDSGYYDGHEDLQVGNVTASADSGSGDPYTDSCGHGTHVAGTIAALDNDAGVIGVNPSGNLNLHIVKVFGDDDPASGSCGWSYSSSLVNAAYECGNAGANVINMSLGGGTSSSTEEQAFKDLYAQGVLSIAAAGNDGNTAYSYPASYDVVVSVAAIDESKTVADFSQKNDQVELAAPGVSVLSTVPFVEAQLIVDTEYTVSALEGGPSTEATGDLVDGGLCDSAGSWSGMAVLCERGDISFADKVANVEAGGGVAAIIYNNEPGGFAGTLSCNGPAWKTCSSIPGVTASQEDGQHLVANQLGASAYVSTLTSAPANGYAAWNGTSMATPHVAGVAALVWSHFPDLGPADIRNALAATAEDLGSAGRDNSYGYGLIQAADAVAHLGGGGGGGGDTNTAPTASFSTVCDELACSFTDGSTDSDGTIASWSWDFGDGATSTVQNPTHTYGADGDYTVTLTVTDDDGATDTTSQTLTVSSSTSNDAPTASFTYGCNDLACDFDGSGSSDSDGSIASYSWDFGDGNTGSGATASHSYASGGDYTVTLTVTDDDGATDSSSQTVSVSEPSSGDITLSASGYKVRGRHHVDLTWDGTTSSNVDIYLDGGAIDTVTDNGAYTWSSNNRGGASYTFQVCEAGTSTCSGEVTVIF